MRQCEMVGILELTSDEVNPARGLETEIRDFVYVHEVKIWVSHSRKFAIS